MARMRGNPIITMRLPRETIEALRICAGKHGLTVSDLMRKLIDDQLTQDGIYPRKTQIEGQMTM